MSRKVSGLESFQMAAKFALKRQQQKKVEVFDSHAIDITQYKDADDSAIFLPRHLKKRQSNQSLNLNKTKVENRIGQSLYTSQNEAGDETDGSEDGDGDGDGLEMLCSVEELRRASLACGMFGSQRTSPQHDTLQAYFKFRKDNMAKKDRLKKVQAKARIRNTKEEAVNPPSMVRKLVGSNSRTVQLQLKKLSFQNNSDAKTGLSQISGVHHHKDKTNRERHAKLPKIQRRKVNEKDVLMGCDPRFQKLLSCLAPLPNKSEKSPPRTVNEIRSRDKALD